MPKEKSLRAQRAGVLSGTKGKLDFQTINDLTERAGYFEKLADDKQAGLERLSKIYNAVAQKAEADKLAADHRNRSMIESLIQERMLFLSHILRIDQRLRVMGIEPQRDAFSLCLSNDE